MQYCKVRSGTVSIHRRCTALHPAFSSPAIVRQAHMLFYRVAETNVQTNVKEEFSSVLEGWKSRTHEIMNETVAIHG